jgi:hypothetical protein
MDPLSVAASVAGLVGLGEQIFSLLLSSMLKQSGMQKKTLQASSKNLPAF